jgi:hypothetical protein
MFWKSSEYFLHADNPVWNRNASVVVDLSDTAETKNIIREIISFGENLCTEDERQAILFELGGFLKVDYQAVIDSKALSLMDKDEIRELSESGLDIQLHTHRHHFPSDHDIAVREIRDNSSYLSQCVKTPLLHFCYPSGIWSEEQWPWLENLGIKSATTCRLGFNNYRSSRYALNRYLDREDISETEFLAEITGFLTIARFIRNALRRILPKRN